MATSRTVKGETKYFLIDFFNGGVSIENMSSGRVISPDHEFWAERLGEREVSELQHAWVKRNPDRTRFFENEWVHRDLYIKVYDMCESLKIDEKYIGDICVPLSNFQLADKSLIGDDVDEYASDVLKLQDVFIALEDPYNRPLSITFEIGTLTDIDPERGGNVYGNSKQISVSNLRAVFPFMDAIGRLAKTDIELNRSIHSSWPQDYYNFDIQKAYWNEQNRHIMMLHEFITRHKLGGSPRNCLIKAGKFFSLLDTDYVRSEDYFIRYYQGRSSHTNYDQYVYDLVRKRVERHPVTTEKPVTKKGTEKRKKS